MSLFGSILPLGSNDTQGLFSRASKYIRNTTPPQTGFLASDDTSNETANPSTPAAEPLKQKKEKTRKGLKSSISELGSNQMEPPRKKRRKLGPPEATVAAASLSEQPLQLKEDPAVKPTEEGLAAVEESNGEAEIADALARTVFVGNLPPGIRRKTLKTIFSPCGAVESVRLRSVPLKLDKLLPRRAAILSNRISSEMGPAKAYIVFKDESAAASALSLNMTEVEGHHMRVDSAGNPSGRGNKKSQAVDYDRSCSIFLGNLPFDATDEEIIRLFSDESEEGPSVKAVRIIRDPATNIGKGFGYVLFDSKNAARMALAKDSLKLRSRALRITSVKPKSKVASVSQKPYGGLSGAQGRLQRKQGQVDRTAPATSWQGMRTKGAGKTVASAGVVKVSSREASSGRKKQAAKAGTDTAKAKRPAVAARKAKMLGLPLPAKAKQKQRQRKQKK